jgi:hypothetical protein
VTLNDLVNAVQAKGYSFTNSVTDPLHPAVIALNSTYRTVLGTQRWPFQEKQSRAITTVYNVPAYSLSMIPDFIHMDAVRIEDDVALAYYEIDNKEPQDFRDIAHIDRTPATPQYWTQLDGSIVFYPIPDQVYQVVVDYIYRPPDLAAATDVPVFPDVYHDVLVWGAVRELAYREHDWLGRNFAEQEFNDRFIKMKEEYLLRQRQNASHVKRSGYNDNHAITTFGRLGW